ncbi:tail fiber protein [Flavobacterium sp.]|uniref:tail fiber protein n=1 Tax=Flavobacterium sp. TaxID=239 RepID=UPI00374CD05C
MNNLFKIICISLLTVININAQSLSDLQQQNARATGYAIVAARNPGKSFSVNVIKWDGIHDLEYNATNKINYAWHPQAVVKGNYFDQPFDGNTFTTYSSVILSQSEFDTYKSTGTDWWIICSTLPAFSNSGVLIMDNGNAGIGTTTPFSKLSVGGSITINSGLNNTLQRPVLSAGTSEYGEIRSYSMHGNLKDDGFLRLSAGGGTTPWAKTYIDLSGYSTVPDMDRNIVFGTSNNERMRINQVGNVGIGTTNPDSKLTVAGNIHAQEVKVTVNAGEVPDYVFANDYKLKSLQEVEDYIKENKHLPEIPSAKEIEKNGLMLAEMNLNLLKKMEEMTLYMIEQEKKNNKQSLQIESLEKENQVFKTVFERLSKIEEKLK